MLADDLKRYVALHRALGFKFRVKAVLLRGFVAYAETHGDSVVFPGTNQVAHRLMRFIRISDRCQVPSTQKPS